MVAQDCKIGPKADLQGADLQGADLRGANLQGADLDFSCLPLWCGSKGMKVDRKIALQILAHFCALDCDDMDIKAIQLDKTVNSLALQSHRAHELLET